LAKSKPLNSIKGLKVLVTAGPTREYWDPIRFLTNASSGVMGIALAQEASRLGADVTLVLGPVPGGPRYSNGMKVVRVVSAEDMDKAVQENLLDTQVFIGAAAVSDYRPRQTLRKKIKDHTPAVTLRLVRNPDIIAKVALRTPQRPPIVIGFALETHDLMKNAQEKLRSKGLDWIVANQESNIGRERGAATLLSRWGEKIPLGTASKKSLACKIWEALLKRPAL
jgi:phosphopantothenoylcysteine decarboxylase / phosphopantothenate---cysteine ligase